jgi:hypothetical protein
MNLHDSSNYDVRFKLSRCWLSLTRIRQDILIKLIEPLFEFFLLNLSRENYEMNFAASEFILSLVDEEEKELIKNEQVSKVLEKNLKK